MAFIGIAVLPKFNIRRKCIFYIAFSNLEKSRAHDRNRLWNDFIATDKSCDSTT